MMPQRFTVAGLPETPWKNGGGTTCEVACWPAGAGLDGFDWRVSIATIAGSGPFSAYAGIDRTIMLLEGEGARLRSRDGSIDRQLDRPLAPFSFPGEAALDCELIGVAPSRDLNVMVRRDRLCAQVCVVRRAAEFPAAVHGLLLAVHGDWSLNLRGAGEEDRRPVRLAAAAGIWWGGAPRAVALEGSGPDASLVAVMFRRKNTEDSRPVRFEPDPATMR